MTKTKTYRLFSPQRVFAAIALVLLILLRISGSVTSQAVTMGYSADGTLQRGMLVSIQEANAEKVEAATQEAAEKLHGVVVDANDAPVTLSAEGQKVFVATTGKYDVLVSNQNGPIKTGDYIAVSSIQGIGMRSDDQQIYVVGKAVTEFDGATGAISSVNVDGRTVNVGRVLTDIRVARNPWQKQESTLPEFLRKAAENVAGKPINAARIYVSVVIFILSSTVASVLLYGGVKNGIISIGRNPLSKKLIARSMMQVIIVGVTIFVTGIIGVYLLLRL